MGILFRSLGPVVIMKLMLLPALEVSVVLAEGVPALSLAEAERIALKNEPGIAAMRAQARSVKERSVAAGALPDPEVRLGVMSLPVGSYDFNEEDMTQKQITVHQMFPPSGSRDAMRAELLHQGNALSHATKARTLQVLRELREAWLEMYYWQKVQQRTAENRALFNHLVEVTRSMYAVAGKNQQDMLSAELELSRLDDHLLDIGDHIRRSRAALGQWIGAECAMRPVTADLPLWQQDSELELLRTRLLQHPLVRAADAGIDSAGAAVDVARSKYKPALGFELTYAQRDDNRTGEPREDLLSVMVTMSIPLFAGNRQDKDVSAAEYMRAAGLHERDVLLRDLQRQLETGFARRQQLESRLKLYENTVLQQSRLLAAASLHAYQSNTGSFAEVMRAYIAGLNTELDFIRLQTDRAKAQVLLDYLTGDALGDDHNDE